MHTEPCAGTSRVPPTRLPVKRSAEGEPLKTPANFRRAGANAGAGGAVTAFQAMTADGVRSAWLRHSHRRRCSSTRGLVRARAQPCYRNGMVRGAAGVGVVLARCGWCGACVAESWQAGFD